MDHEPVRIDRTQVDGTLKQDRYYNGRTGKGPGASQGNGRRKTWSTTSPIHPYSFVPYLVTTRGGETDRPNVRDVQTIHCLLSHGSTRPDGMGKRTALDRPGRAR